jgi:hypothetical protein
MILDTEEVRADARYLCSLSISVWNRKPCYLRITEGRGAQGHYGWCGDFVSYVLMRNGVRDGSMLNRAELNMGHWEIGHNIRRILDWAKANGRWRPKGSFPADIRPGDVVIYYLPGGDHISFFDEWLDPSYQTFRSLDGNSRGSATAENVRNVDNPTMPTQGMISLTNLDLTGSQPNLLGDLLNTIPEWKIANGGDLGEYALL